jgi:NAD/NADP transhydrogenase beta subunit
MSVDKITVRGATLIAGLSDTPKVTDGREQDMDQGRGLRSQQAGVLWAFVGIAIGAGVYRLSKLAFGQLDGLTNASVMNAAAATTFVLLLIFVVVAVLWTRRSGRPGSAQGSKADSAE